MNPPIISSAYGINLESRMLDKYTMYKECLEKDTLNIKGNLIHLGWIPTCNVKAFRNTVS